MSGNTPRFLMLVSCLALLVPVAGCFLVADVLNPGVVSALGFDPAAVIPSQGRMVIVFNNATQYPATNMFASVADDVAAATEEYRLVSATDVAASETVIMVEDCPVGVVAPGGASIVVDGAVTEVAYEGSLMVAGEEYRCGDVLEMRVVQLGDVGSEDTAFAFQVRVLRGR